MVGPRWLAITNPKTEQTLGWVHIVVHRNPDEILTSEEQETLDWVASDIGNYASERVYYDDVPARLDFCEEKDIKETNDS